MKLLTRYIKKKTKKNMKQYEIIKTKKKHNETVMKMFFSFENNLK